MRQQLTVLQLVPALHSGGVERGTLEVAAGLVRHGHRSIVISGGGRLVQQLLAEGSEHVDWPIERKSPLNLRFVPQLRRLLRERGVNIVHARSRMPAWIGYLAWRGMPPGSRPAFVTTMHGLHSVGWYSSIMTRGERVIAVSQTIQRHILENYPLTAPGKIRLIHRGVDPGQFPRGYKPSADWLAGWRREYPQLVGHRVLSLPGRITRLKGHADFIELVARLNEGGVACYGLIVGDEDAGRKRYANEIREYATRRAGDRIVFTGHRADIRDVYAVSDVVMALSQQPESFGRTVLEALCLGVPVVGYNHGGVGEILAEMLAEGRVEVGDVDGLIQRVSQMLTNRPAIKANDQFTLDSMIEKTLAVYGELSAKRGARDDV